MRFIKGVCPNIKKHSKIPEGYIECMEWMDKKYKAGYRQKRCPNCNLFAIWYKLKT